VKLIDADLKAAGIELFREPIEVFYRPDESDIKICHDAGKAIAEAVKNQ
jgi:flavorubredoxin